MLKTAKISFSKNYIIILINIIKINNKINYIIFYILNTFILFLFLLKNINCLKAYFNNTKDIIIQKNKSTLFIIYK